jgi:hypothetical protein
MICRCLFTLLVLLFSLPSESRSEAPFLFQVESGDPPSVLLERPVQAGDLFSFHYIHSADKTPVRDTFRVGEEGEIILIEEAFLWYGSGLEFQEHEGVSIERDGPWTRVRLNRRWLSLPIRVGRISQQTLVLQSRSYRLDEMAKPGEVLIFSISR